MIIGNTREQKLEIVLNEASGVDLLKDIGKKLALKAKERKSGDKFKV